MQNYERLDVWVKAHHLAIEIYRVAAGFPRADGLALTSQVRRAALSIPANIAEGAGSAMANDFRRFLQIAMASASETRYHLLVARDLQLISEATYHDLSERLSEVRRMLTGLIRKVAPRTRPAPKKL
ncbi:four helix bundle protein [soil metagenome]